MSAIPAAPNTLCCLRRGLKASRVYHDDDYDFCNANADGSSIHGHECIRTETLASNYTRIRASILTYSCDPFGACYPLLRRADRARRVYRRVRGWAVRARHEGCTFRQQSQKVEVRVRDTPGPPSSPLLQSTHTGRDETRHKLRATCHVRSTFSQNQDHRPLVFSLAKITSKTRAPCVRKTNGYHEYLALRFASQQFATQHGSVGWLAHRGWPKTG